MIAIGICMINNPPVAVHIIYQRAVAFRPPTIRCTICMHNGIVRWILPGAGHTFWTGGHNHVARCGSRSPSLGGSKIIISVVFIQFRGLQTHAFRIPMVRIFPSVIYFLLFPDGGKSVLCQSDHFPFIQIKIAVTLLIHHMTGVNPSHLQVNGAAPRTTDVFRPHHPIGSCGRIIDVISILVFQQIRRHGRTFILRHDTT